MGKGSLARKSEKSKGPATKKRKTSDSTKAAKAAKAAKPAKAPTVQGGTRGRGRGRKRGGAMYAEEDVELDSVPVVKDHQLQNDDDDSGNDSENDSENDEELPDGSDDDSDDDSGDDDSGDDSETVDVPSIFNNAHCTHMASRHVAPQRRSANGAAFVAPTLAPAASRVHTTLLIPSSLAVRSPTILEAMNDPVDHDWVAALASLIALQLLVVRAHGRPVVWPTVGNQGVGVVGEGLAQARQISELKGFNGLPTDQGPVQPCARIRHEPHPQ